MSEIDKWCKTTARLFCLYNPPPLLLPNGCDGSSYLGSSFSPANSSGLRSSRYNVAWHGKIDPQVLHRSLFLPLWCSFEFFSQKITIFDVCEWPFCTLVCIQSHSLIVSVVLPAISPIPNALVNIIERHTLCVDIPLLSRNRIQWISLAVYWFACDRSLNSTPKYSFILIVCYKKCSKYSNNINKKY